MVLKSYAFILKIPTSPYLDDKSERGWNIYIFTAFTDPLFSILLYFAESNKIVAPLVYYFIPSLETI